MTVAAGLHRGASNWLMREIGRHDRRRAAKEPERVRRHELVTQGQKLGDPLGVGFRKNRYGVSVARAMQLRMGFTRRARSQLLTVVVSVCTTLQCSGHGEDP
jgi:hypothetical protein